MAKRSRRDTTITDEEKELALYFGHNFVRSKKAREVDNASTKGLNDDFAKMWVDPSRHDWPEIDTVVRRKPKGFTKEKGKKAFDNISDILGSGGF